MAIQKTEGRDEFFDAIDAVFAEARAKGKELSRNWTAEAAGMMKALGKPIDRERLRRAKGKRHVYSLAIPALKLVLGLATPAQIQKRA